MASRLFCMGNPLLDISANVPEEVLTKYGLTLNNAILAEEKHFPIFDELVANYKPEFIAGGATQNAARVCQWAIQTPGAVSYVGCVGKDEFGTTLETEARKDGINVQYLKDESTPTGTCAVLVNGKERSLVARLGAAEKYSHDHFLTPEVQALLDSCTHVYIAAFFLTHSPDTILAVAKHCAEKNKVFMMNLAAPFLLQVPPFQEKIKEYMPYLDYVFGNESEAVCLAEMYGWENKTDLDVIAKTAADLPKINGARPRHVVFTNGPDPTIIASSAAAGAEKFSVPPMAKDDIIDTNGAGDAMVGGFLSQLLKGKDHARCAEIGHWTASHILKRSGCTFPEKPDRADL